MFELLIVYRTRVLARSRGWWRVLRAFDKTKGRIGQFRDKNFTISRIAANVRFGDYLRTAGLCLKSTKAPVGKRYYHAKNFTIVLSYRAFTVHCDYRQYSPIRPSRNGTNCVCQWLLWSVSTAPSLHSPS